MHARPTGRYKCMTKYADMPKGGMTPVWPHLPFLMQCCAAECLQCLFRSRLQAGADRGVVRRRSLRWRPGARRVPCPLLPTCTVSASLAALLSDPFGLCCLKMHKDTLSACVLRGCACTDRVADIAHTACIKGVPTGLGLPAQKAKNCTATHKERGSQSESKTSRVGAPFTPHTWQTQPSPCKPRESHSDI